jgi:hypothetical protein
MPVVVMLVVVMLVVVMLVIRTRHAYELATRHAARQMAMRRRLPAARVTRAGR